MTTATQRCRSPLGLFPDKPAPRMYDRIVEVLRVRHYSRRTVEAYIHWIRRYIEFHQHRLPVVLTVEEVSRVMSRLTGDKRTFERP